MAQHIEGQNHPRTRIKPSFASLTYDGIGDDLPTTTSNPNSTREGETEGKEEHRGFNARLMRSVREQMGLKAEAAPAPKRDRQANLDLALQRILAEDDEEEKGPSSSKTTIKPQDRSKGPIQLELEARIANNLRNRMTPAVMGKPLAPSTHQDQTQCRSGAFDGEEGRGGFQTEVVGSELQHPTTSTQHRSRIPGEPRRRRRRRSSRTRGTGRQENSKIG